MGRYLFEDIPPGKKTIISTHGYWYVQDDDRHGNVSDLGLTYDRGIDDLTDPELDAEDDGWSFMRDKLEAYFND